MIISKWTIGAALMGAALYLGILHRFQTYSERNRAMEEQGWVFAFAILAAGVLFAWGAMREEWSVALALICGLLAAHCVAIAFDLAEDPSNHNLLPFELIAFALLGAPALVGAGVVKLVRRKIG